MNIKKATIRLTALYTLVLLLISSFFSASLYRVSQQEINSSFKRQANVIKQTPQLRYLANDDKFIRAWDEAYDTANKKLLLSIFTMNAFVLVMGGLLSYLFARRTLDPIEKSHNSQKSFTADASHELRTPISVMKSEIEVALRDKKLTLSEAKEVLNSNLEEVNRLTTMIEALLNLSRLEAEDVISINKLSIKNSVESSVKNFSKLAKDKKIIINTDLKDLNAKSNEDYIVQVFSILIDNAIKYSPENSTINVSSALENNKLVIRFIDEGKGISDKEKDKIFNRFYRGDSSRSKSNVDGLGLGLSLAKQILSKMNSEISVNNNKPKGSIFIVKLPKS
jgi:two-component system sensor histidine kinase CiaH